MKKRLEFTLIAALFLLTVVLSAYQLGVFSFKPLASVHPQSQSIAMDACGDFGEKYGLDLIGVQIRVGVQVGEAATDTAICEFRTGTLAYMLIYSLDGEFQTIQ